MLKIIKTTVLLYLTLISTLIAQDSSAVNFAELTNSATGNDVGLAVDGGVVEAFLHPAALVCADL